MVPRHLQATPQFLRLEPLSGRPLPTEFLERRQREPARLRFEGGHHSFQPPLGDTLRTQELVQRTHSRQHRLRSQEEFRADRPDRRPRPPLQPVPHLVRTRTGERVARRTFQRETLDPPERLSLRRVDVEVRQPGLLRLLPRHLRPQPRPTEEPLRERSGQPHPLPAERQPRLVPGFRLRNPGEHLETPVQERRGRHQFLRRQLRRGPNLPERLPRTRPQAPEHPERRAVPDPRVRHLPVEVRNGDRCEPLRQRLDIRPLRRRPQDRRPALRVEVPRRPVARRPAHHFEPLVGVEDHLHRPALLLAQHQRTVDLHLGERRPRTPAQRRQRLDNQRQVERPGGRHLSEHPVVGEPLRIAREQLRLEGDLPVPRVAPDPQQRMSRRRPPPLRSRHPVPLPLERIRGQRHPATALARKQTRERDRKPRLVRLRHRADEVSAPLPRETLHHQRRCGVRPRERRRRSRLPARPDFQHHADAPLRKRLGRRQRALRRRGTRPFLPPEREADPLFHIEGPRRQRRRQLSRPEAGHRLRPHADARPERREPRLQRVDLQLGPLGAVEAGRFSEHHLEQRMAPLLPDHRLAAVQDFPERGFGVVELPAHPRPRRAAAGVEEGDLASGRSPARPLLHEPESFPERRQVAEAHTSPVGEVVPADARRPGRIGEPGVFVEEAQVLAGQVPERRRRPAGKGEQSASALGEARIVRLRRDLPTRRPALQDQVRIRPREPEPADRRP